jgi:hypothetical protein
MIAEALLCGCQFIGDQSKIGSLKEFLNKGSLVFKENCQNASQLFWQKIEQA